jgi:hypothetical protein
MTGGSVAKHCASKNDEKTRGKPFEPGNPGGPGRPAGSRNKATLLLDKLADDDAEAVLRKQIVLAKAGDQRAAELILSRVWPVRKSRTVALDIPPIAVSADVVAAIGAVATAMSMGELTPDEAAAMASVLEMKRRAIETIALEKRIESLEVRSAK